MLSEYSVERDTVLLVDEPVWNILDFSGEVIAIAFTEAKANWIAEMLGGTF